MVLGGNSTHDLRSSTMTSATIATAAGSPSRLPLHQQQDHAECEAGRGGRWWRVARCREASEGGLVDSTSDAVGQRPLCFLNPSPGVVDAAHFEALAVLRDARTTQPPRVLAKAEMGLEH